MKERNHDPETGLPLDGPYSAAGGAPPAGDVGQYDPQAVPISGPFAGMDPDQLPVIVDEHGQRVKEKMVEGVHYRTISHEEFDGLRETAIIANLWWLAQTHTVQIETGAEKPLHRIVIGMDNFSEQLHAALEAARTHHAKA